jgi:hypothetical protein
MVDVTELDENELLGRVTIGHSNLPEKEYKWVCVDCGKELGTSLIVGLPEKGTCGKCNRRNITTYEVYKK